MDPVVSIDYDELLAAYWKSLTTKLRGFNAGADFLGYWVPEDDTVASLLGLVEAALAGGVDWVQLRNKSASAATTFGEARQLLELTRPKAARLAINDRLNQVGMFLPSPHTRLINGNLNQPGAEACFPAELPNVLERLQHCLLCCIFSISLVAQNG